MDRLGWADRTGSIILKAGQAATLLARTLLLLLRDGVTAVGTALILLVGSGAKLARMVVRPDRFERRQLAEAIGRAVILPLPLTGALAAVLGVIFALAIGYAFTIVQMEEVLLGVLRQGLMRQAVPLLVGLIVLGRAGLGLAARLAAMTADGENDTLRSLGIPPAQWVLPAALLEFVVLGAVQFVCAAAVGQFAAALVLLAEYGIPAGHSADALVGSAARADFWSGFARSEAAALLGWLVSATSGVNAVPGPEQGAAAVRTTFLMTLLGILVIAALFTWLGA